MSGLQVRFHISQPPTKSKVGEEHPVTVAFTLVGEWPYPAQEEVFFYCFVDTDQLFESTTIEDKLIAKRDGTTTSANFKFKSVLPGEGVVLYSIVNQHGMPMTTLESPKVEVIP